jgi:hypothetical protein
MLEEIKKYTEQKDKIINAIMLSDFFKAYFSKQLDRSTTLIFRDGHVTLCSISISDVFYDHRRNSVKLDLIVNVFDEYNCEDFILDSAFISEHNAWNGLWVPGELLTNFTVETFEAWYEEQRKPFINGINQKIEYLNTFIR